MNVLDVCAGSGIGSWIARQWGMRTVCYVERDPDCIEVLKARMRDGSIDEAPVWDDLRTFDGRPWRGLVDGIFGGIPCQPYSVAGKGEGEADERDLWPDFWRIVREVEPGWFLAENVPGLLVRGLERILREVAASGHYSVEWDCIPAASVGAPHRRDRVWIVAYASGAGRQQDARGSHAHEAQHAGRSS